MVPPKRRLDRKADSNYSVNGREMQNSHIQDAGSRRPFWVVLFCILLVVLFFYNPFVALISPTGGLAYHSLSRYRATVGVSELQQFSPQQSFHMRPELFFLNLAASVFRPQQHTWRPAHIVEVPVASLAKLPSNLLFRPPPAA
jgi:hypothetical protein